MSADPRFWALVPAAGSGRRMGAEVPKQYLRLGDRSVLEHTLDTLLACERIAGVVLVIAAGDRHWPEISGRYQGLRLETTPGGEERCQSVLNGLQRLADQAREDDWVLVHDAARPCVRQEDIDTLMDTLADDPHGGLLGLPVADTVKRVDAEERVEQTVAREGLWRALTPQMFRFGLLRAALQQAIADHHLVTDEAAAMERAGYRPRMVPGHADNIKITLPSDLTLAAHYLQARASS